MRNLAIVIGIKDVEGDLLQETLVSDDLFQLIDERMVLEIATLREIKYHLELLSEIQAKLLFEELPEFFTRQSASLPANILFLRVFTADSDELVCGELVLELGGHIINLLLPFFHLVEFASATILLASIASP